MEEESDEENEDAKKGKKRDKAAEKDEIEEQKAEEANLKKKPNQINVEFESMLDPSLGIYKRGTYIKIVVDNIKYRHYKNFSESNPLVLCRINPGEDNFGFVKVRIKKHRWYGNILKSNDPLIFSIGWRRYQSIPIFCVKDPNDRYR